VLDKKIKTKYKNVDIIKKNIKNVTKITKQTKKCFTSIVLICTEKLTAKLPV